jgi:hypothetical protein
MFKTTLSETTHRLQGKVDAWDSAAHDVRNAWETWRSSSPADRGHAYGTYCVSLDREEHAAAMLAAAVRSLEGAQLRAAA